MPSLAICRINIGQNLFTGDTVHIKCKAIHYAHFNQETIRRKDDDTYETAADTTSCAARWPPQYDPALLTVNLGQRVDQRVMNPSIAQGSCDARSIDGGG